MGSARAVLTPRWEETAGASAAESSLGAQLLLTPRPILSQDGLEIECVALSFRERIPTVKK